MLLSEFVVVAAGELEDVSDAVVDVVVAMALMHGDTESRRRRKSLEDVLCK